MGMRLGLIGLLLSVALGGPASAHPHVFIDGQFGFKFDTDGKLSAIQVTWAYDAFSTLQLMEALDLDKDRDGALDDADRARIVTVQTTWPEGFEGDTYLEQDGDRLQLWEPVEQSAWMTDTQIHVSFDLPLVEAIDPQGDIVLRAYDPTYYFAYTVVGLEDGLREGCRAEIIPFKQDKATAAILVQLSQLSQEETPEDGNVGRGFADEIRLTCD